MIIVKTPGINALRKTGVNAAAAHLKTTGGEHRHAARLVNHLWVYLGGVMLISILPGYACAQQYVDYPLNLGKVQPLMWSTLPVWMTLDMDLRARGENQTAWTYESGNEQLYMLTRPRGGLEVRPIKWLTGYLQFQDARSLALPTAEVNANMHDTFDLRQGFLRTKTKHFTLIAGRQELKYGGERLVGMSDWTNVGRTWDGFLGRIGDRNRLDVFSTSVVV